MLRRIMLLLIHLIVGLFNVTLCQKLGVSEFGTLVSLILYSGAVIRNDINKE
jgi:hypothetical protein